MKKNIFLILSILLMGSATFANMEAERYFADAHIAYQKGDYNTAISKLKSAIKLEPRDSQFYFTLGMCYLAQGNPAAAQTTYLQASKVQPNDFRPYLLLGDLKESQGQKKAAVAYWKKGLSLGSFVPDSGKVAFSKAKILYSEKIRNAGG